MAGILQSSAPDRWCVQHTRRANEMEVAGRGGQVLRPPCAAQHSRPEKLFSLLSELLLERHLDTPHGPFIRIGIGAQLIVVGQA